MGHEALPRSRERRPAALPAAGRTASRTAGRHREAPTRAEFRCAPSVASATVRGMKHDGQTTTPEYVPAR